MASIQKISPCLWFDGQVEEAAKFYVSIFKNSRIGTISHFGKEGFEIHGRPEGSQIAPAAMQEMMTAKDPAKSGRVMNALFKMKKLDLATLQKAYDA